MVVHITLFILFLYYCFGIIDNKFIYYNTVLITMININKAKVSKIEKLDDFVETLGDFVNKVSA